MSKKAVSDCLTFAVSTVGGSQVVGGTVFEGAGGIFVWQDTYAANQPGAYIWFGCVELPKETGVAFTKGDQLYWDATNDNLDKTNTNIVAGICAADAASGDTVAKVFLNVGAGDA